MSVVSGRHRAAPLSSTTPMSRNDGKTPSAPESNGCVLVIAGDDKSRQSLCRFMETWGYAVKRIEEGRKAVEKALANSSDVLLVSSEAQVAKNQEAPQPPPAGSAEDASGRAGKPPPKPSARHRISLSSTGVKAQFAVAIALNSVMPLLIVTHLWLNGWLGAKTTLDQLWPLVALVLPFMGLGYWMLFKYPVNILRLRNFMENLTHGVMPDQVELVTDEDDLAAIETLMQTVVKQTEERVNTIKAQTDALLEAERQRVMIEALGTACHHLGQPATVIIGYLDMTRRMDLPPEAQAMLEECRVAADAVADILDRLQKMTVYRTEPYLLNKDADSGRSDGDNLIKI